ncbi:MAG: HAD-IA family hydrolase [Desulfovibrio sp.]|nr:HAD-IA family hydrolase [Desulfovibrio sp.]
MTQVCELFPFGLAGIIYDCDGVMINSRKANSLFYNRVLAYFGLPPMTEAQEHYSFMATGMQALQHILPKSLHPQILPVVKTHVRYADVVPQLELMPGFRAFFDEIRLAGLPQAMCTNRTKAGFEEILRFFAFPHAFDPVMTSSEVAPKPSPEGAAAICRQWGVDAARVLFVGDSAYDREAAHGAGVRFAAFNGPGLTGDLTARDYQELRDLLAPLLPTKAGG